MEIQSETAIRHVATQYPYDTFSDNDVTLRGNTEQISEELTKELQERLAVGCRGYRNTVESFSLCN